MANLVQNYKSRPNVACMPKYKDSFSLHTTLWSVRWLITCYPVFQLRSWTLTHTNVQKSALGVEPAKPCILSFPDLTDSQPVAAGSDAFQNQLPKYSDLIWERGEIWSTACPSSPLAVDSLPSSAVWMWSDERDRKQKMDAPEEKGAHICQNAFTYYIPFNPHIILYSSWGSLGVSKAALFRRIDHFPTSIHWLCFFP